MIRIIAVIISLSTLASCSLLKKIEQPQISGASCATDEDCQSLDFTCRNQQCSLKEGAVPACENSASDADCDGVASADDCDDADPNLRSREDDQDCDGVAQTTDCDDAEAILLDRAEDADCDGVLTSADCDDDDSTLREQENDSDCDGVIRIMDCDDSDVLLGAKISDGDCDGIIVDDDCNDGDATFGSRAIDKSCNGFIDAIELSAGQSQTCAVSADGRVQCWGNRYLLGSPSAVEQNSSTPVTVQLTGRTSHVSVGFNHACAVDGDGAVWCWGRSSTGSLGEDGTTVAATPVRVENLARATKVSSGAFHVCALMTDRTVSCWGLGSSGQLGNGDLSDSVVPVPVSGLGGVTDIAAGSFHTCAVVNDGSARCWGSGTNGQLGQGQLTSSASPVLVTGLTNATSIAAGGSVSSGVDEISNPAHSCAILADQTVRCWGSGVRGQLGDGNRLDSSVPVTVVSGGGVTAALGSVVKISTGPDHSCAVFANGRAVCWGGDYTCQLGIGVHQRADSTAGAPVTVEEIGVDGIHSGALLGIDSIAVGGVMYDRGQAHTCSLMKNGVVRCWGKNISGEIGVAVSGFSLCRPVEVVGF